MSAAGKVPVVDCHALFGAGKTWADPVEQDVVHDLQELLSRGAEAGIDRYCLTPARNDEYAEINRQLARECEKRPGQLTGFAAHSPQREAGRLAAMLKEEVRSMGLRAVRSDGPPNRELMDAAAGLGIPVICYPKAPAGQAIGRWLHTLLSSYPAVALIVPHLGQFHSFAWWGHIEVIDAARRYPNLYLDTSALGSLKYLELAVKDLPAEKILFGSGGPYLDPRVQMEAVRLMKLPPEAGAKILGGNILRLLKTRDSTLNSRF